MAAVSIPTKFLSKPSSHLTCFVCKGLFIEPVINVKCGHTFCRKCISNQSVDTKFAKCPQDAVTCELEALVVNRSVQSQIEDLLIYCRHGLVWIEQENDFMLDQEGCTKKIKYGKRNEHEDDCDSAKISCPNNSSCNKVRRKNLQTHLQACPHNHCPHNAKGCSFTGSQSEVSAHIKVCGFRGLRNNLPGNMQQHGSEIIMENQRLTSKVESLSARVAQLERDKETMHGQLRHSLGLIAELTDQHKQLAERVDKMSTVRRSPSSSSSPNGSQQGHSERVWDLKTCRSLLFSAGDDNIIKVWDLEALAEGCKRTLQGHKAEVRSLCCGQKYLYSAGSDFSLRAWSLEDLSEVKVIEKAHDDIVASLICSEDHVFSSSHTVIKVWDAADLRLIHSMSGLKHWVRCLAFNTTKDKIYSGSHNTIEIWDALTKFNLVGKISHSYGSVHALAVTSQYIIAGTYNQNIHIFDVTNQKHLRKLSGHVGIVMSVVVTHSERFLFSASSDSKIQIWSLVNFLPIQALSRHEEGVNVVILHNDLLLSGSEDKEIKVFKYFKMAIGFIPS